MSSALAILRGAALLVLGAVGLLALAFLLALLTWAASLLLRLL